MIAITPVDLKTRIEQNASDYVLLDIREVYERDWCWINEKSIHIPMADVMDNLDKIDKSKQLIVICRSGKRASAVANMLELEKNFNNPFYLEGGIQAYSEEVDQNIDCD
jgi:rhodanese-related sulfurtransferase